MSLIDIYEDCILIGVGKYLCYDVTEGKFVEFVKREVPVEEVDKAQMVELLKKVKDGYK